MLKAWPSQVRGLLRETILIEQSLRTIGNPNRQRGINATSSLAYASGYLFKTRSFATLGLIPSTHTQKVALFQLNKFRLIAFRYRIQNAAADIQWLAFSADRHIRQPAYVLSLHFEQATRCAHIAVAEPCDPLQR